ncbi:hypothetical protein SDC9_141954 [bioreactor metagenome]|uniref:Uncharacterized protein n=1 Tax=bioreactor metagenome TaxID=1076179 RepID=A0A645DZQ2_9ZZZZ
MDEGDGKELCHLLSPLPVCSGVSSVDNNTGCKGNEFFQSLHNSCLVYHHSDRAFLQRLLHFQETFGQETVVAYACLIEGGRKAEIDEQGHIQRIGKLNSIRQSIILSHTLGSLHPIHQEAGTPNKLFLIEQLDSLRVYHGFSIA